MSIVHLNTDNFEQEVLKSDVPVLVDFWAEWCGPCKMIGPIVEEVANEVAGKMKVAKLNIDEGQQLAVQYSVMAIPTLIVFKDGAAVDQIVGAVGKDQLLAKVNAHV